MNPFMFSTLRKSRKFKAFTLAMLGAFLFQTIHPTMMMAIGGGPSQPEVQSFQQAGVSDMVNLFTGDFSYNIPLFELPGPQGGYPFNLSYQSGVSMDQEASWVGLGWNLSPGAINRTVRGLPDEFNGDKITKENDMKPSRTVGVNLGTGIGQIELSGADMSTVIGTQGNLNLNLNYNNYRGIGYTIGAGLTLGYGNGNASGLSGNLGLSLGNQDGVGVNGGVSINRTKNEKFNKYSLGVGLNSKRGADLSLGVTKASEYNSTIQSKEGSKLRTGHRTESFLGSASMSFSKPAYSPVTSLETQNRFLDVSFKVGGSAGVAFPNATVGGSYNWEYLKNRGDKIKHKAYGYTNVKNAGKRDIMDFNRENDGVIRDESPNLASSYLTYDFYNIQGQGIGGMFRPFRNDIPQIHDPFVKSRTAGASVGLEAGGGAGLHLGNSVGGTYGESRSGPWNDKNDWFTYYDYHALSNNHKEMERVYYKVHGEYSSIDTDELDYIGGTQPVRAHLEKDYNKYVPKTDRLDGKYGNWATTHLETHRDEKRMARSTVVQPIKNSELGVTMSQPNQEIFTEYAVQHYTANQINQYSAAPNTELARQNHLGHHYAGFSVLNTTGQKYIYGLPAYNNKSIEAQFTVDRDDETDCSRVAFNSEDTDGDGINDRPDYDISGTEKYFSRTETPAYAHAYLLTSVLGNNYVDSDNTPGPSDDDQGYWVKFNYVKLDNDFAWRAPFHKANFLLGQRDKASDNKGAYSYGEREVWQVATAETKTHIAVFEISERRDGRSASGELAQSGYGTGKSYKLDKIKLYSKEEYYTPNIVNPTPIQTVHFEYNYESCRGILNNGGAVSCTGCEDNILADDNNTSGESNNSGKLTLKKVYITYEKSNRGAKNAYQFHYSDENPNYSEFDYDRWGNYQPGNCDQQDNPYVEQFTDQSTMDKRASAWNLNHIELPTGAAIDVTYEADDYGFVQHREATQMFKISKLKSSNFNNPPANHLYNSTNNFGDANNSQSERRVFIDLEHPISSENGSAAADQIFKKQYLDGLKRSINGEDTHQLYFKLYVNLVDPYWDYVTGYVDLEMETGSFGVDLSALDSIGNYTRAYVTPKLYDINGTVNLHPFAVAAMQYVRTSRPNIMNTSFNDFDADASSSKIEKATKVRELFAVAGEIESAIRGFRRKLYSENKCKVIDLNKSFIKLCSPDQKKYGGGSRVKQIQITDNWANSTNQNEASSSYGQVYEYTTTNESGATISSGVAQYEPMAGGDENPLKYAKAYPQSLPFQTNNNLFFEYPINESLYPGASVGYSEVTVKSINTQKVLQGDADVGMATGVAINEFYTAKDFPVIADETMIEKKPYRLFIPIPLIGMSHTKNLTATQGYSVELNDMHGKPKAVRNYGITKDGHLNEEELVNEVNYHYNSHTKQYDGKTVNVLDSELEVLKEYTYPGIAGYEVQSGTSTLTPIPTKSYFLEKYNAPQYPYNSPFALEKANKLVGVEYDFSTDQRKSMQWSVAVGLNFNVDVSPLPIPSVWPKFNYNRNVLKTATTNKVIHRSGVLVKTDASDGKSKVVTENKLFDELTGRPILTQVNNNYDEAIYSFNEAAYHSYENMRAAYHNIGFTSNAQNISAGPNNDEYDIAVGADGTFFFSGDELLIRDNTSGDHYKATVLTGSISTIRVFCSQDLTGITNAYLKVIRSGHRNLIATDASTVVTLKNDPTENVVKEEESCHFLENVFKLPNVLSISAVEYSDAWNRNIGTAAADQYSTGELGIWRPKKNWYYKDDRFQTEYDTGIQKVPSINLSDDGVFTGNNDQTAYWFIHDQDVQKTCQVLHQYWKPNSEIVNYNAYGFPTEQTNALAIPSSSLFGYKGSLNVASAVNAHQNEIAYYSFDDPSSPILNMSWIANSISRAEAHSGHQSIKIESNTTGQDWAWNHIDVSQSEKFVLGAWLKKETDSFTYATGNTNPNHNAGIRVSFFNGTTLVGTPQYCYPSGEVIEGWQRIEKTLTVPSTATTLKVAFLVENTKASVKTCYFDDLRFFPADASFQTSVYDPDNYRLMATLDANNFATFFSYNEEGSLFLTKKETKEGIKTIQESRSYAQKNN